MKRKIIEIINILCVALLFITLASCSGLTYSKDSSDKAVLKIAIPSNPRMVVPDSDFSSFSFELKAGETTIGTYNGKSALESEVIDLSEKNINVGDTVTLSLTATKDGIIWKGSSATTIKAGENLVTIKLFVTALGTGNGSFAYTLDYSGSEAKVDIQKAHVVITSKENPDAAPVVDEWYGFDATGTAVSKTIPASGKIEIQKSNIAAGNYKVAATLYASADSNAKINDISDDIAVAAGTVSTGTAEVINLNTVHTITFDLNYEGSTPFVKKLTWFSDIKAFAPERDGYVFKGWYESTEYTREFTGYNATITPYNKDVTVYAKWETFAPGAQTVPVFNSESLYVTDQNYTICTFTSDVKSFWYKIATQVGKQYKILWVTGNSKTQNDYIINDNGDLLVDSSEYWSWGLISAFNKQADQLVLTNSSGVDKTEDNANCSRLYFTAESSETFINVSDKWSPGKIAFRVMEYNPDAQVTDTLIALVSVVNDDIGVKSRQNSNTYTDGRPTEYGMYFEVPYPEYNDYESFNWCINGTYKGNGTSITFWYKDYIPDVYTITLEAVRKSNSRLYSYCSQLTIPESN